MSETKDTTHDASTYEREIELEPPTPVEAKAPKARPLRRLGASFDESIRRGKARKSSAARPIPLPWPDMAPQFGGGLWSGLHVLVGGTGSGKTAWALQVALHAAKNGFPVGYVGLELDEMQIDLRILGEDAKVPWSRLYLGTWEQDEDIERVEDSAQRLAGLPFYYEEGRPNGWPISELGAFADSIRSAHPEPNGAGSLPMLLVLDFLQIVGDETSNGRAMGLDLRERIGRAAYLARDVARRHNAAVLLISSAARDKYALLAGALEDGCLSLEEHDPPNSALPPKRRSVLGADSLIGLGKESGEIEYSADSVTVAIRWRERTGDGSSPVVFATAKGRATGELWSELRFNGYRFDEAPEKGRWIRNKLAEKKNGDHAAARALKTDSGNQFAREAKERVR